MNSFCNTVFVIVMQIKLVVVVVVVERAPVCGPSTKDLLASQWMQTPV